MPVWIKFWTAWAVAGAVWLIVFLIAEGAGLARAAYGDTLTETVVYLRDKNSWLYWLIIDVVAINGVTMGWLLWHFRFWVRT